MGRVVFPGKPGSGRDRDLGYSTYANEPVVKGKQFLKALSYGTRLSVPVTGYQVGGHFGRIRPPSVNVIKKSHVHRFRPMNVMVLSRRITFTGRRA